MAIVRISRQMVAGLVVACGLSAAGCHGQVPAAGTPLSPELELLVEILIRQRAKITPDVTLTILAKGPSEVPGYDQIEVVFTSDGEKSKPNVFLLSKDGKTIAQFNKFDISKDPMTVVSSAGRPGRGGPASAPVQIVMFDDLECPYCARMHKALFPALTQRYGNEVRVVYRDYPLSQHVWAMRAAVDVNCVGSQSGTGYWNLVDYIHDHASDFGGSEHSVQKANEALDQMSLDEAKKSGLNAAAMSSVDACIKKQDQSEIKASLKLGDSLDIAATPVLFINGEKFEGAYPVEDLFRMVDQALTAEGVKPPPPYAAPSTGAVKGTN
jgi:protein-disulfide isomerase